jgi:hypothetical protein
MFRVCSAQLYAVPDLENQLHSKFFKPKTPNSRSFTTDLLKKIVELATNPWI